MNMSVRLFVSGPALPLSVLALSCLVVLALFSWLGLYAYPSADDFCMASGVAREGLLPHLWHHYFEWSGRYSGNAFYAIYPLIFGFFNGVHYMPLLLILSLWLAFAFFLSQLFRLRLRSYAVILTSLCLVTLYVLGIRHSASSLFWMAGALSYQTANILLLLIAGLMIRLYDAPRQRITTILLLAALVFIAMGTNETAMLALMLAMAMMMLCVPRAASFRLGTGLLLFVVAVAGFLIVYLAPGNVVREASFPLRHDWGRALEGSLKMGAWTLIAWVVNPLFVVSSLMAPYAVARLKAESPRSFSVSNRLLLSLSVLTISSPFVLQFPAWWAMGGWPPPRTVDAIFFVFLLLWLLLLVAVVLRFSSARVMRLAGSNRWFWLCVSLFVLTVWTHPRFQRALDDLQHKAKPFAQYMQSRHDLIDQALMQQRDGLVVPDYLGDYPRSIYFNDILPDWRDWRNRCYADYVGLRMIQRDGQRTHRRNAVGDGE